MTSSLLLTNGYVHSVSEPYANALHIDHGVVAWLGADDTAQQMVAATTTGPVATHDVQHMLVTPAFVDGFSNHKLAPDDSRITLSSVTPAPQAVFYAPVDEVAEDADGMYVPVEQLDQLPAIVAQVKPPTQLLIGSTGPEDIVRILAALEQQPNAALMRCRHRVLMNHSLTDQHVERLVKLHASVTLVPDVQDGRPVFYAPTAALISGGVHVATGSGSWSGSMWDILTALIEHPDESQRVSTRAAFNTMSRDGVRVLPSKIAQANMTAGQVAVGSPADLNIWRAGQLGVQVPDVRAAHWSTDKRAGTALLPILSSSEPAPELVRTVRNGQMS
ncbi:hypothetical protein GCM10023190_03510 [Enteractinococcus fodinae]|uniref:Amidohydrolase YtcJ n=1 Tax=Enteractinococcus fodinae TaxID=684663 RepID=A0ABU2B177_9MICC|nr:amidohydrolase family protein [Enteractinococcus fodinae]MDR7347171.1 putative amidohydrolase YtcJ [Enteractinococcus fodinae]